MNTTNASIRLMVCVTNLIVMLATAAQAQAQPQSVSQIPLPATPPSGYLGALGAYRTIEGVLYDGSGKVESNTLVVDTVDGKRLPRPIQLLVRNVRLPSEIRCTLKGYELGEMIGRPPAEYALTKELGGDPNRLAARDATGWRWRPYFVPLIVTKPKGLEVTTKWGIQKYGYRVDDRRWCA